jgi:YebC/PmpR family DNA-binding regulatory protein
MSGHSKWSTIKRKKGAADAKRGRIFSRLNKEIMLAARNGGGDPDTNIRLRNAIAVAKEANMPKDNITRAVKKGAGELDDGSIIEEINYEGYGPGGIAVIVETITDNRNRTTADVRHAFAKFGGNLGETGCVGWMFARKGLITFLKTAVKQDQLEEVAIENGADDIKEDAETVDVTCAIEDFEKLKKAFEDAKFKWEEAEISNIPQSTVKVEGRQAESVIRLIEALDELDDVQHVSANFDISEADLQAME